MTEATREPDVTCGPADDPARLAALAGYGILDTERDPAFDDIADLAAELLDAPIAVVNFIAEARQWFKAERGIGVREMPLDVSICRHIFLQPGVTVVPDLREDARFVANPLVAAAGGLRFYAGAALRTGDGHALGTVCVLDTAPRPAGLVPRQERALRALAAQVMAQLEARRAAAAAREEGSRFRALFEQSAVGALHAGLDGTWTIVNRRFAEMLEYGSPEELVGRSGIAMTHPDDREEDRVSLARLRSGELPYYHREKRYLRRDGTPLPVAITVSLIRDAAGAPTHCSAVVEDLSARMRAEAALREREAELRRVNEGLEARVRDEVAAREAAQVKLVHAQRMEALGQLAGGIAHDFNNVLQAVQGGARLIQAQPGDAARTKRLSMMIAEAAGRGASITRRLLAFARRGDLRAEPVDAASLLGGLRDILMHTLGAGIGVRVQVPAGLPPLLADKGQLETVLVNLAANARDAMGGAGALTLSAAAAAAAGSLAPGSYVRISVSDTGMGMDAATLARASEPFFTTKPVGQGTGLGLAMARGFAEQSNGALEIESAPGRGTTVRLWFPAAEGDAVASIEAPDIVAAAPDGVPRVLLVDDEALVREITAQGLEAAGFAVHSLGSSVEALDLLRGAERVDLLVSDLSMPGMNGLSLIAEAQRARPGLPAILLTGFATDAAELAMGGALTGSFSLLRKPVEAEALAERASVLLRAEA